MAEYFEQQSSNRYSVVGDVNGWVKVPFNEARYGRDFCGGIVCNNTWFLIRDAMSYWVQGQLAAGKTDAQIIAYLKQFDVWDRYDLDGDGELRRARRLHRPLPDRPCRWRPGCGRPAPGHRRDLEPSLVRLGSRAAARSGLPGVNVGSGGASGGLPGGIPNHPVGVWVGDYTIQPENGGLGVFAHEYGHDLGLPDLYDTSGNTGGAENSTGFWTLMSSGANIGDGRTERASATPRPTWAPGRSSSSAGSAATRARAASSTTSSTTARARSSTLGPNDAASKLGLQAALRRAARQEARRRTIADPKTGSWLYWSTMGDEINTSMTKAYTVPAGGDADGRRLVRHRGALRLRVPRAVDERRHDVDAGPDQPVDAGLDDQSGFNASGTGITGSSAAATRR